ncbi:MAG: response regulator [Nodosilinea sp.]
MVTFSLRAAGHHGRIVVIEDDDANRLVFTDYLTYAGFTILALPSGLNLSYHLQEFRPDLMLLDLGLPDIDGYSLLASLRSTPQWAHLPVIVVSGYAFPAEQQRAMDLGINRYLVKPIHLQELIESIQTALRLSPLGQPEAADGEVTVAMENQEPDLQREFPLSQPESP